MESRGPLTKTIVALVWPLAAITSLGFMFANRRTADERLGALGQRRDSLTAQLSLRTAAAAEKLTTGDSLPDVDVVDAAGRVRKARAMARAGVHFWYLYRNDCAPCQVLAPAWSADVALRSGGMARVAFDPAIDLEADTGTGDYAWRHDSLTRRQRMIEYVPALLVVNEAGVITNAGYGLPQVAKMGGFFHLIDQARALEAVRAIRSSGPAR